MQSQTVEIPVGNSVMKSYFAAQEGERRPAVIVLQEIFGVNTEMRRITDLLASNGFAALAINYYHRTDPDLNQPYNEEGMKIGMTAASKTSRASYREDIEAAIAWLNARPEVDAGRIATWGFCMGGSVAFYSATFPEIKAAVSFYGGSIAAPFASGEPEALIDTAALRAPLFLAFGGQDHFITPEKVARTEKTLKDAGKTYELKVYPDQDHGFFRQSSNDFSTPDVADAWKRVQAFLADV
jgi:carboxymethylenebutenolidase